MTTPADTTDPADGLPEMPEAGPDGGGPGFDPVLELSMLLQSNAIAMNDLAQQGVTLNDSHPMVTAMIHSSLLEAILTDLAGEGRVTSVLLSTHQQIADLLKSAESSVAQARLTAGVTHNGRVTTGKQR